LQESVPELFESNPDLLFHLTTIFSPLKLRDKGVDVFAVDQRPGDFIITFPRAYHSGFNHGVNFYLMVVELLRSCKLCLG
jgi:histone demethylase JARID1